MYIYIYIYIDIYISVYVYVCVYVYLSIYICSGSPEVYVDKDTYIYVWVNPIEVFKSYSMADWREVCVDLSRSLSLYLSIYLYICLSIYLSLSLSISLSVYLCKYVYVYMLCICGMDVFTIEVSKSYSMADWRELCT